MKKIFTAVAVCLMVGWTYLVIHYIRNPQITVEDAPFVIIDDPIVYNDPPYESLNGSFKNYDDICVDTPVRSIDRNGTKVEQREHIITYWIKSGPPSLFSAPVPCEYKITCSYLVPEDGFGSHTKYDEMKFIIINSKGVEKEIVSKGFRELSDMSSLFTGGLYYTYSTEPGVEYSFTGLFSKKEKWLVEREYDRDMELWSEWQYIKRLDYLYTCHLSYKREQWPLDLAYGNSVTSDKK